MFSRKRTVVANICMKVYESFSPFWSWVDSLFGAGLVVFRSFMIGESTVKQYSYVLGLQNDMYVAMLRDS